MDGLEKSIPPTNKFAGSIKMKELFPLNVYPSNFKKKYCSQIFVLLAEFKHGTAETSDVMTLHLVLTN